jgi:hypothetical protein
MRRVFPGLAQIHGTSFCWHLFSTGASDKYGPIGAAGICIESPAAWCLTSKIAHVASRI